MHRLVVVRTYTCAGSCCSAPKVGVVVTLHTPCPAPTCCIAAARFVCLVNVYAVHRHACFVVTYAHPPPARRRPASRRLQRHCACLFATLSLSLYTYMYLVRVIHCMSFALVRRCRGQHHRPLLLSRRHQVVDDFASSALAIIVHASTCSSMRSPSLSMSDAAWLPALARGPSAIGSRTSTPTTSWLASMEDPPDSLDGLAAEVEVMRRFGAVERFDALLCPVLAIPAFAAGAHDTVEPFVLDGVELDTFHDVCPAEIFNITSRCPVLTVPAGRSADDVPIGVEIVCLPVRRRDRLRHRSGDRAPAAVAARGSAAASGRSDVSAYRVRQLHAAVDDSAGRRGRRDSYFITLPRQVLQSHPTGTIC